MASTYSNGANDFGKSSGALEGMTARLGRLRRERIWRRRGEVEARITRFWRSLFRAGRGRGWKRGIGVGVGLGLRLGVDVAVAVAVV